MTVHLIRGAESKSEVEKWNFAFFTSIQRWMKYYWTEVKVIDDKTKIT